MTRGRPQIFRRPTLSSSSTPAASPVCTNCRFSNVIESLEADRHDGVDQYVGVARLWEPPVADLNVGTKVTLSQ
jgi:hypothetical protein